MNDKVSFFCNGQEVGTYSMSKLEVDSTQYDATPLHGKDILSLTISFAIASISVTRKRHPDDLNEVLEKAKSVLTESAFLNFKSFVIQSQQPRYMEAVLANQHDLFEELKMLSIMNGPDEEFILNPLIKDIAYSHNPKRDASVLRFHPRKVIKQYRCRIRNRPNSGHGFRNNKY